MAYLEAVRVIQLKVKWHPVTACATPMRVKSPPFLHGLRSFETFSRGQRSLPFWTRVERYVKALPRISVA